jgi:phytoene dehydrogenase-like protein
MDAEVVVVGGGIGGLTVAALLAARGVDVCLLERESNVGGCAAGFEKFGYQFEQGYGLYGGWEPGGIHARIFSQLPVEAPKVVAQDPSYVVRLPDRSDIAIVGDEEIFFQELKRVFPECAEGALAFYRNLDAIRSTYRDWVNKNAGASPSALTGKVRSFFRKNSALEAIMRASQQVAADQLAGTSLRFRRFIDVQLQTFTQATSRETSYLYAAIALSDVRGGMFGIHGGASTLAAVLAASIKASGGKLRLNSPALRLAYNSAGEGTGVDLMTGETINASRAIISNLTIWDTYGKLVGLNRTPAPIRQELKSKRGWGAYLLYLGLDETTADSLLSDRWLALNDWHEDTVYDPENCQFFYNGSSGQDPRGPAGKRAVTVHTFTDVEEWFTFHTDESELEQKDQQQLEACWKRLHTAMPELGDSIEVIDTATPRSYYDQTRRKLGMAGGLPIGPGHNPLESKYQTTLTNLFIVSDTTSPGDIASLSHSALSLADHLTL